MPAPQASRGARFYSTDLHLHTPASHDYKDKSVTPSAFVAAALSKGLEIIAVTDHNSAEWVDQIRVAARKTTLIVFPGVEVSTPHCHILAIFDRATPKTHIDDFLTTIGITTVDRGKKEVNSKPLEDVLTEIHHFGGIAIAAHANSTNGLLQQGTGQYRIKMCADTRVCALEFTQQKHVDSFEGGTVPGYSTKACLQGSDAHAVSEIGRLHSFLKMDEPSLWSMRQAFADFRVRIRHAWNRATDDHSRIQSLSVTQGFFGGLSLVLHPALNCIVGGRGTGKSTVIELLRFGFDDVSAIDEIASDNASKLASLLGDGGKVSIKYRDADGVVKTVERELQDWETGRTVKTDDGADAEILAPPVFFSQGELTRIATQPTAQLDLIDRYVDVEDERNEERRLIRDLKQNGATLLRLQQQTDSIDSEVTDGNTGLLATRKKYADLEKTLQDPVLRDFPLWESEGRYVADALKEFDAVTEQLSDLFDSLSAEDRVEPPAASLPNSKLLDDVPAIFEKVAIDLDKAKATLLATLKIRRGELEKIKTAWQSKFGARKTAYDAALTKAGTDDVKKAQAQLRALKRRLDELEKKASSQATTLKQLEQCREQRHALLVSLNSCRSTRYEKRSDKTADWNARFDGRIRVGIAESADRSKFVESLRNLSRGAMLRDTDLESIATECSATDVRQFIESGDFLGLAAASGIRPENARKLIETAAARTGTEVLDLEAVALNDVPEITYEVQPGSARGLSQLSVGQKATVIISLALVEGDNPLVIDQPEEPLDTLAITNPVVDTLRSQKETRQFVFTTHNANVAVGADAELNVVLEAGTTTGAVKVTGGVDHSATNKLLVLHLEGGPDAIQRRVQKYRPPA